MDAGKFEDDDVVVVAVEEAVELVSVGEVNVDDGDDGTGATTTTTLDEVLFGVGV